MSISKEGLTLLKQFEGFRPRAIELPGGRWLIGYGHTRYARAKAAVTEEQAELLLRHDLVPVVAELNTRIFAPLSQNQFDALAMFAFNVGLDSFRKSGIAAHLNAGEVLAAARQIGTWRTAIIDGRPVVVDALVRRRTAEQGLFLRTPNEVRPASTHLVIPMQGVAASPPPSAPAPDTIRAPNAAPSAPDNIQEPARSGPPKPPSTLRTRFYDLLRAKRPRRGEPAAELDISERDVTWAGPAVLLLGALTFVVIAVVGFVSLSGAGRVGVDPPPLALAAAFGGIAGAASCLLAALRLIAVMRAADDPEAPG